MALQEPPTGERDPGNRDAAVKRRLAKIQQRLRRAECSLEQAAWAFCDLMDDITSGSSPPPVVGPGTRRHEKPPAPQPVATAFVAAGLEARFVVHRVEFRVELTPARMDLLTILTKGTPDDGDPLAGFTPMRALVHALRLRGWDATRRSVTVEIARVREQFGPANRHLIETKTNVGYRFRLLRSAAPQDEGVDV